MRTPVLLLVCVSPIVALCFQRESKDNNRIKSNAESLLVVTGGNEEAAVPCGCTFKQAGGVSQVARVLLDLRSEAEARKIPIRIVDVTKSGATSGQEKLILDVLDRVKANFGQLRTQNPATAGLTVDPEARTIELGRARFTYGSARTGFVSFDAPKRGEIVLIELQKANRVEVRTIATDSKDPGDSVVDGWVAAMYQAEKDHLQALQARAVQTKSASQQCQSCHSEAFDSWQHSAHSRALQTLVKQGKDVPECLKCHQTESGPTTAVNSVECGSCHADSERHALSPSLFPLHAATAKQACVSCHTAETDPKFDYSTRYRVIDHLLRNR